MEAAAKISDLRHSPTYSLQETARYLTIPVNTLRGWIQGGTYTVKQGKRISKPLLQLPDSGSSQFSSINYQLSFINLVEAHMLRVIRSGHHIPLQKVRTALDYIDHQFDLPHPLARIEFQTDGVNLFIESIGRLINTSQSGQLALRSTLENLLDRVELDEAGVAARLYPLTQTQGRNAGRRIVIDPRLASGRPVLVETKIPTADIFERYQGGDSMDELAEFYGCDRTLIEEAVLCELLWHSQHSN